MLYTLLYFIEIIFLVLIGCQVLYLFVFAVASVFPHKVKLKQGADVKKNRIIVFIPGYKEDRIIVDTASQALEQTYPKGHYELVVLADSFAADTVAALKKLDVKVLEVSFENSTKAKSLNRGLEEFAASQPDIAVVLDSDNIMAPDFLAKVNAAYNSGHRVIQGHRTAKNQETSFALLDAINEEISNNIFRKGHRKLGLSSALIGSAMAFDYGYFKEIMSDIRDVAGEDKLLEVKITKGGTDIEYLHDALVYDEKVSSGKNFSKQRTRWVGAQLYFLKHYFFDGVKNLLVKGNLSYFTKVYQFSLIPKVLLIGLLGLLGLVSVFTPLSLWWLYLALLYFGSLLLAVPRRYYNFRLLRAMANIPGAILFMILGILRIRRGTASKFEVTEKGAGASVK